MQTPPSPSKRTSAGGSRPSLYDTPPSAMSRLPTISTPSRASTSSSGLPTPSARRPRSSLGASQYRASPRDVDDPAAELALQEALKHRPPSSLRKVHSGNGADAADPDTPPASLHPSRTPATLRARTPSALGHGHHPTTPSSSRAVSRGGGRPSIGGTATPLTNRRTSMASSTTSSTPYARRPESRANHMWTPVVGERVRLQAMGMEGTLRYMGETEFKAGIWAGVELEGGFAGKGKNDGSVNGVTYFACPPACGVFVLASKLSAPTTGVSRPASVASSHLSFASSASGRATPSFDRERFRPSTTTPSRSAAARTTSTSARARVSMTGDDDDPRPVKTLLGNSSSSNAAIAESKITAGSRASKYIGMTAKHLENARTTNLTTSTRGSATPKVSRVSMGGPTPSRPAGRQSLGNSLATPRPRVPRASNAADIMPPPPSPGHVNRVMQAHTAKMEEELRELRERNSTLESRLEAIDNDSPSSPAARSASRAGVISTSDNAEELDALRKETESLRRELSASQADATDASKLAEELRLAHTGLQSVVQEKEKQLQEMEREMKLAAERAQGELDAGMEAKREEVGRLLERAELAEQDGSEMRALVEELTQAGQATISLYENKQYDLEDKIRSLEDKSRLLEERLVKAREEAELAASSSASAGPKGMSATEIDNETLTAQLKHFQNRVSVLEEELEEARTQAEADGESWKTRLSKAKEAEKLKEGKEREAREEIKRLERAAGSAKTRIQEMENALKENRGLLEVARADIEGMRVEVAEVASMRSALQNASEKEKQLLAIQDEAERLRDRLARAQAAESKVEELEDKISSLESQLASAAARSTSPAAPSQCQQLQQKGRLSIGSVANSHGDDPRDADADKRMKGFQHIISELSAENSELKEKYRNVMEEIELLKEENKLLEETKELTNGLDGESSQKDLAAQATIKKHEQTIQELNREMAELESLIESKIYREDELESRLSDLEKELGRFRSSSLSRQSMNGSPVPSHSRTGSTATAHSISSTTTGSMLSGIGIGKNNGTEGEGGENAGDRCELCEGPHDLDACPVFSGDMGMDNVPARDQHDRQSGTTTTAMKDEKKSLGVMMNGSKKWCADCESNEHDTAECPLAEEVF